MYVTGGPGSGRGTQAKLLVEKYKGWSHLSMGDILRGRIFDKGSAEDKWNMIGTLVQEGNMAPEVGNPENIKKRKKNV